MEHLDQQIADTIDVLQQCHAICSSMAMTHCLEMGGEHARPQHLRLMLDCAGLCAFTADALGRESQFTGSFAALCADVCEICEKDCEALGDMEECVEACSACVAHCRQIARVNRPEIPAAAAAMPPAGH